MMRIWIKKAWKLIATNFWRIRAFNLLGAGIQLSEPAPDLSFARAQEEWELRHEIYLLAGEEAYRAKDGERRLQELMVPEVQAVEMYLAANPEMRRWADRNIEAGTCAAAAAELRKKKEQFRHVRLAQLGDVPLREPNPEFDWLRQAARGRPPVTRPRDAACSR